MGRATQLCAGAGRRRGAEQWAAGGGEVGGNGGTWWAGGWWERPSQTFALPAAAHENHGALSVSGCLGRTPGRLSQNLWGWDPHVFCCFF